MIKNMKALAMSLYLGLKKRAYKTLATLVITRSY